MITSFAVGIDPLFIFLRCRRRRTRHRYDQSINRKADQINRHRLTISRRWRNKWVASDLWSEFILLKKLWWAFFQESLHLFLPALFKGVGICKIGLFKVDIWIANFTLLFLLLCALVTAYWWGGLVWSHFWAREFSMVDDPLATCLRLPPSLLLYTVRYYLDYL